MLLFATPGAPLSTPSPGGTLEGLHRAHELGMRAVELEWVQQVPRNVHHVEAIGETARKLGIALTVHAPFYINLNAKNPTILLASKKRILTALTMAEICGAISVCVHGAFYLGMDPERTFENVRRAMGEILKHREKFFPHVNLALETMGKPTQFGSLEEVLALSKEFDFYPCLDAAHLHARYNGSVNSKAEWHAMFDTYESFLGKKSLMKMHLHFSGISYGPKGERKHLELRKSDARWKDFLNVLKERNVGGVLVCESPNHEEDTLLLQRTYAHL